MLTQAFTVVEVYWIQTVHLLKLVQFPDVNKIVVKSCGKPFPRASFAALLSQLLVLSQPPPVQEGVCSPARFLREGVCVLKLLLYTDVTDLAWGGLGCPCWPLCASRVAVPAAGGQAQLGPGHSLSDIRARLPSASLYAPHQFVQNGKLL